MPLRSWCRLLPVVLAGACMACAHVPVQRESVKRAGIEASTSELRTRLVELGRDLLRATEIAADSVDAMSPDPRIRRNTLLWRLSSVPAVTEAVLREDPVVAAIDITAYRAQLTAFLDSRAGEEAFGDGITVARRTLAQLSGTWVASAEAAGAVLHDETRAKLTAWVDKHPIEHVPFTRETPVTELAKLMSEQNTGVGAAVGGIQETMQRMELRMSLTNEFGPKEAVWLAQLAAIDVGRSPDAAELRGTLGGARQLFASAPDLMAHERQAALGDIDRQRRETLDRMSTERQVVLDSVTSERIAVLDAVDEQRRRMVHDMDSLRVRMAADADRIVDHFFLRLVQVVAGVVVLVALGAILLPRLRSPDRPAARSTST